MYQMVFPNLIMRNEYYRCHDGVFTPITEFMYNDMIARGKYSSFSRAVYSKLKYSVYVLFL